MKKLLLSAFAILSAASVFAQNASPSPATLAPLPPSGFVTLDQIVNDFRNAPDQAQNKYGGQELIVYGRVGQLTSPNDADGALVVYLQQYNNPTPDVKCIFDMDDIPQQASLELSSDGTQAVISHRTRHSDEIKGSRPFVSVDERVGIKGDFSRFVAGDIELKDCEKVGKEKLDRLLQDNNVQ